MIYDKIKNEQIKTYNIMLDNLYKLLHKEIIEFKVNASDMCLITEELANQLIKFVGNNNIIVTFDVINNKYIYRLGVDK